MTNVNNTATHFDLHTTGVGYLNRAREVKPQTGKKFKPFWSVGISALRGNIDEVEYSRIDTNIVGSDAKRILTNRTPVYFAVLKSVIFMQILIKPLRVKTVQ